MRGIPVVHKAELKTGDIVLKSVFPELAEYESIKTQEAAETFLMKVFEKSTTACNRDNMCLKSDCKICTHLYVLYHSSKRQLTAKRNEIYYKCLVGLSQTTFAHSLQKEVYLLGFIDFLFLHETFTEQTLLLSLNNTISGNILSL